MELYHDGSLRRFIVRDHQDDFYIAPDDAAGFSDFIRSVRLVTWKDKAQEAFAGIVVYGGSAAFLAGIIWLIHIILSG